MRRSSGKNDDELGGLLLRPPAPELEEGLKMALSAAAAVEEMGGLRAEEEEAAEELGSSTARRSQRHMGQNPVKFSSG